MNELILKLKRFLYRINYNSTKHLKDIRFFREYEIKFYNWYKREPDFWLLKFIYFRKINNKKKSISIFSVFGYRYNIFLDKSLIKIFYTGENVHAKEFSFSGKYTDNMLKSRKINLSIGFDYIENDKYIRFPLWMMYVFDSNATINDIKSKCDKINHITNLENRNKFCSLLARTDRNGIRRLFYNQLSNIDKIDCDSLLLNNNNELKTKYNDDKIKYLSNYKFNLCPENSDYPGYCTEKLFESFEAGCIPIYWGCNNNPEPDIINSNAIIFLNPNSDNTEALNLIARLNSNADLYQKFIEQRKFKPDAYLTIHQYFTQLENKLNNVINN